MRVNEVMMNPMAITMAVGNAAPDPANVGGDASGGKTGASAIPTAASISPRTAPWPKSTPSSQEIGGGGGGLVDGAEA
jgi:hypothetical protein